MIKVIVSSKEANQRIDKFVKKYLNEAPLSFVYKLFRKKDVKVNGHWVKQDYFINEGEEITLYVSEDQLKEFSKPKETIKKDFPHEIIYEDENIIITPRDTGFINIDVVDNENLFIAQSQTSIEKLPQVENDKSIVPALKDQIRTMAKKKSEKPMCAKLSDFVINGKDSDADRLLSRGMKRIKKSCEYNNDNEKLPHLQCCVADGIEKTVTFEKLSMKVMTNNPCVKQIIDDLYTKKYSRL